MNHPGEIAPLVKMARPHVVIITTVAEVHLEAFNDINAIAKEKASICQGLEPDGVAIVNGDLSTTPILIKAANLAKARIITFGQTSTCHHCLTDVRIRGAHTVAQGRAWRTPILLKVGVEGRHFALNGLAVIAAVSAVDADRTRALIELCQWQPPGGRGTIEKIVFDPAHEEEYAEVIDDAYNSNPTSLSASLEVLAGRNLRENFGDVQKGRRIAILGDMLELGQDEANMHANMAQDSSMQHIHIVHCVGPRMRHLYEALPEYQRGSWFENVDKMIQKAGRFVESGDIVLVKGSKGSRVSAFVDALRKLGQRIDDPQLEG